MFNLNEKQMLLDLFHTYGPSHNEGEVLGYILSVLDAHQIPYKQDKNGNIYCLNHKNEPLLSAHTDCVGTAESGAYVKLIDIYPYGDEEILKGIGNIGGDDKCGVFLILLYLLSGKPINAFFSVEEEVGGFNGITTLLKEINEDEVFKTIPYCLVLDRKNPGDIICKQNSYGSAKFDAALEEVGKDFGYTSVKGGSSDTDKIKEYMNACNLSVAYFNPHSTTEFVSLNDLYNTWQYVQAIIEKLPRDIPLEKPKYNNNYYNGGYYNGNYYGNNYNNNYRGNGYGTGAKGTTQASSYGAGLGYNDWDWYD